MKPRRLLCYILILLFSTLAYAQNKAPAGIELCNEVHSFLKANRFSPSTQNLVTSGENTFPYNIIVTFTPKQNTSPENLLLVFFQEDVPSNKKAIREALKRIQEAKYPLNITVLFAYGEKQELEKTDLIYGTQAYLESLTSNYSHTAVIFDLESDDVNIETTANSLSSPPLLIKTALNLYSANEAGTNFPAVILSQISSYRFISSRILSSFFENEIPAIKLSLGGIPEDQKYEKTVNIITGFVQKFSTTTDIDWEHHYLIVRLFGTYHTISERMILHIVIPTIFIWIIFIFTLIFVNRRLQRHTWSTIGEIWWSVPLTYALAVAGFFISGILFRNIFPNATSAGKIYGQLVFQICSALFLTFSAYLVILTTIFGFDERAVDYLLVISCFINQSLFILIDISLSPIFIVICLLSLLALFVKNNYLHLAVFVLMVTPLVPYIHKMIGSADLKELASFVFTSKMLVLVVPLVLYPVYIVLFRTITAVRTSTKKIRSVIIYTGSLFAIICAILITHGLIRTSSLNKQKSVQNEIKISPLGTELIELSVSDQEIFDDVIRTIDVTLKEKCLLCDILITTQSTNPVLYSDNDYINPSTSSARFRIPNNPPQEMTFSYGAAKTPCRIIVSAVINGETDNEFLYISRSLLLGDN